MTVKKAKLKKVGFSLVELMIVLSIVGVIVTLALPRFQQLQYRARQAEAKTNLNHIYLLQETYFSDNSSYGRLDWIGFRAGGFEDPNPCDGSGPGINDIGFKLTDCSKVRYVYRANSLNGQAFTAEARSDTGGGSKVCPGADELSEDRWSINQNKNLAQITKCEWD